MKFEIILNQQTPESLPIGDINTFINYKKDLINEFLKFADTHRTAVGLAATQVSLDGERLTNRFFAIRNLQDASWSLIINPIIEEYIGMKEWKEEGCFTWPGKMVVVERYRGVKVSYYNINGEKIENEFHKGFEAQIWQHEVGHLNGTEERIEEISFKIPTQKEPERNDRCPCGSGKKYKNCCLNLE